ncbi:class I SAM-dependent methyltransferase [Persephonella sp.]
MAQEKLAAKIFDSVVTVYDKFLNFATFNRINAWQRELVKNTPSGDVFVDVGTGTGEIVRKINQEYPDTQVIGIDVALGMLKVAREKTDRKNLFIQASAYNLPFKTRSIDAVFLSLVFRHLDSTEAVTEFDRILKDRGCISILDISRPSGFIYRVIYFFADKLFRPFGEKIFTKEEYNYFVESLENSRSEEELTEFMEGYSFRKIYSSKKFAGIISIVVFQKVK